MRQRTMLLIIIVGGLVGGCGYTTTNRVIVGPVGPPYTGQVQVYMEGSPLPEAFTEVAIIQAIGSGLQANMQYVVDGLRREAAALGCDAVVRVKIDQGQSQASGTGVAVRTSIVVPPSSSTAPASNSP